MGLYSVSNVKGFYRSGTDNVLCGVCGGIGVYLGVGTNVVYLPWVLLGLLNPLVSATLYMVTHLMLPENRSNIFVDFYSSLSREADTQ